MPLWTCLHLMDQGRHGSSTVYDQWSAKFGSLDCVMNPPRTQSIVEFHQKSAKHISMNSKRDRLDGVVQNLYLAKKSKSRYFEIAKSRCSSKNNDSDKIKDKLSHRIVTEKWKKPKQSAGPGYFQKNRTIVPIAKPGEEDLKKSPIIPWGGAHQVRTSSGDKVIELVNTCPVDNILEIYSKSLGENAQIIS